MTAPTAPGPATAQLVMRRAEQNAHYRRAVETDEYRQAMALWREATRRRSELEPTPRLPMPTSVDHDLDEWLYIVENLEADERQRTVRHGALTSLITICESQIQSIVHDKNRLLASLARDLDQIMTDAKNVVARLNGAQNAAQAIERGAAEAWQQLAPIRAEYDGVRQAQHWVMAGDHRVMQARSEYLWTDDLASDMAIATLDNVFRDWKHPPRNNAIQQWDNQRRLQPWPEDPVEQLVWLCSSGAEVWCPTTRQLDELKAQRQRARAHPDGEPQQQRPEPIVLNQAPRQPDYSRVARPVAAMPRPAELTELGAAPQ